MSWNCKLCAKKITKGKKCPDCGYEKPDYSEIELLNLLKKYSAKFNIKGYLNELGSIPDEDISDEEKQGIQKLITFYKKINEEFEEYIKRRSDENYYQAEKILDSLLKKMNDKKAVSYLKNEQKKIVRIRAKLEKEEIKKCKKGLVLSLSIIIILIAIMTYVTGFKETMSDKSAAHAFKKGKRKESLKILRTLFNETGNIGYKNKAKMIVKGEKDPDIIWPRYKANKKEQAQGTKYNTADENKNRKVPVKNSHRKVQKKKIDNNINLNKAKYSKNDSAMANDYSNDNQDTSYETYNGKRISLIELKNEVSRSYINKLKKIIVSDVGIKLTGNASVTFLIERYGNVKIIDHIKYWNLNEGLSEIEKKTIQEEFYKRINKIEFERPVDRSDNSCSVKFFFEYKIMSFRSSIIFLKTDEVHF